MNLIEGEKYRIITYTDRPVNWSPSMTQYMGKVVTLDQVVSKYVNPHNPHSIERGHVRIVEDGGMWYWDHEDFEDIVEKLNFGIDEDFTL